MTNLKPYDISKRRVLVATRTKTCAGKFSVPLLKMGEGLPRPTCRSRPQTTSMLLCPKDNGSPTAKWRSTRAIGR